MARHSEKPRLLKKAAALTATAAAAAAVTLGTLFGTADELMNADETEERVEAAGASRNGVSALKASVAEPAKPADRLRALFLRQNTFVRALVLLPLWAVGKVCIGLVSLLFTALSPYWGLILGVLLNALVLVLLFGFVYKALFPNRSLKALFNRKTWPWLAGGAVLLAVADAVLKHYWGDWSAISLALKLFGGFWVLAVLCARLLGRRKPAAKPA